MYKRIVLLLMLATIIGSNAFCMRRKTQVCERVQREEKNEMARLEARIRENSKKLVTLNEIVFQTSDEIKKTRYQQEIEKIEQEVATDSTRKVLLEANRLIREANRKTLQSQKLKKRLKEAYRKKANELLTAVPLNVCEQCGEEGYDFQVCGRCKKSSCKTTYYCSRPCQKKNWKKHKRKCGKKQTS